MDEYREKYHGYLEQVATEYLSSDYLETETNRIFELISEYVKNDPTAFYTYAQFQQNITSPITITRESQGENQGGRNPNQVAGDISPDPPGLPPKGGPGANNQIPGILSLAAEISTSIQRQLQGELPSTNGGKGMGMAAGGRPNMGQRRELGPQGPVENEGQGLPLLPEGGGREQLPEGFDREAVDLLRQEIRQAGGLTAELREKAKNLGLSDDFLAGISANGDLLPQDIQGNIEPGLFRGERRQGQPIDKSTLILYWFSGALLIAAITLLLFFKRRRYCKI